MQAKTLLQNTSSNYRNFLTRNFGKFAPYNDGLMPWRTQWNLSAAYDLKLGGTHKLTFRADIFNVLNLLHYSWGAIRRSSIPPTVQPDRVRCTIAFLYL